MPSPAAALHEDIRDGTCLMDEVLPALLKNLSEAQLRESCQKAAQMHAKRHANSPPFASPVHWAAFIATGAAFKAGQTPSRRRLGRGGTPAESEASVEPPGLGAARA